MANPTNTLIPKFAITFNIVANTLDFLDISTGQSATTIGLLKITHIPSGTILYKHDNWDDPVASWTSPDIHGDGTPVWSKMGIALPTVTPGEYKFEYRTSELGATAIVTTTRSFSLDYTAPVVVINMTVLCSSAQLISDDATDYNIEPGGVQVVPTVTRAHTITKPAGSGYSGTLGTTTDKTRTIGGTVTPIWTRIWHTNIVSILSYHMADWTTKVPTVYVNDTVKGDDDITVNCSQLLCALAICYRNLFDRWIASLTSNFEYRENKRDDVIACQGLFIKLYNAERCGTDTQSIIEEIQARLVSENCNCNTESDDVSVPVVPWASITGTGGSGSTFVFHIQSTNPSSGDGNDGDVWLNNATWFIYKKIGGAWVNYGCIQGPAGAPGTATQKVKLLVSDIITRATPASNVPTAVSYAMAVTNDYFVWEGDFMEWFFEVKLAHNPNEKILNLYFDSDNLMEYHADDLVTADNDIVQVYMKMVRVTNISQHLTVQLIRAGLPGDSIGPVIFRNYSKDMTSTKTVVLYGTAVEGVAGDITGYTTAVKQWLRETLLVPGGSPSAQSPLMQTFVAEEGQTEFVVTDFTATDYYIPIIDENIQSQLVVTRSGQTFTTPPCTAGQKVIIIRTYVVI